MSDEFVLKEKEGVKYYILPSFEKTGLVLHAFTTKTVSDLETICQILNIRSSDLASAEQVHGNTIAMVEEKDRGRKIKRADALITKNQGIPLVIRTADCVPIFILDPIKRAIGLVHAGWKGSIGKIAQKTVTKMQESLGTQPKDCLISLAPSIGPCCYEVDKEVIESLKKETSNWRDFVAATPKEKWHLNLRKLNREQLLDSGIQAENITESHLCTSCQKDLFYSYRRDGPPSSASGGLRRAGQDTGRMFGVLMLYD